MNPEELRVLHDINGWLAGIAVLLFIWFCFWSVK